MNLCPPLKEHRNPYLSSLTGNSLLALIFITVLPSKPWCEGFAETLHQLAVEKAETLAATMSQTNLAMNFLANERALSTQERLSFAASGLTHLLALSGAQVQPLCAIASLLAGLTVAAFIRPRTKLHSLMSLVAFARTTVEVATATVVAALFGASGAILRVAALSYAQGVFHRVIFRQCPWTSSLTRLCLARAAALIFATALLGNPFASLSFLLSALGSCVSMIVVRLHGGRAEKTVAARLAMMLSSSCATSLLIGFLLFPLFRINPFAAAAANLFAVPVVGLCITPVALLLLALPQTTAATLLLPNIFDKALSILSNLATVFSFNLDIERSTNLGSLAASRLYLTGLLLVLWSLQDVRQLRLYVNCAQAELKDLTR